MAVIRDVLVVARQSIDRADESNVPRLLAITGTFFGLAILVVTLRMIVRAFILKKVGVDDWVIIAAAICSIGTFACLCGEASVGFLGRHMDTMSLESLSKGNHWLYFHSLIVMVGISLVKMSVAFFLRRFTASKKHKQFLLGCVIFLIAFTLACAGTLIFNCGTTVSANWNFALRARTHCFSNNTFRNIGIFNSSINILTDVLFALLPVPIVWRLHTTKRTKVSLTIVLGLGLFACAASLVKTVYQANVLSDPDWSFHYYFFMWNYIELNVGILAASLPSLRPLFAKILGTAQRFTSGGSQSQGLSYENRAAGYRSRDKRSSYARQGYLEFSDLGSNAKYQGSNQRPAGSRDFATRESGRMVSTTVTAGGDGDSDEIMLAHKHVSEADAGRKGIYKTTTVQISHD